ncbi:MAG: YdcF family protein [Lactobacillales bacterium]|jgi:uncharacterized SAM-binding protein YcdF (DUF218 family)|nr:YdcF family protein [Lactobacillales bacterium]
MRKFLLSLLLYFLILAGTLWVIGFCLFAFYTISMKYVPGADSKAIVVLTGGEDRISTALELLEKNNAEYMLISGVNEKVSGADLLTQISDDIQSKVTLGYEAKDTVGNAVETSKWLKEKEVQSLVLVTSFYHMPRSITEILEESPYLKITPFPVFPKKFEESTDWVRSRQTWLLFLEYNKYLFIHLKMFLKGIFF